MPQPGDQSRQHSTAEDSFLDLLVETLETMEKPARGQFLQRFLKTIAQLELEEGQAIAYWDQIILRRQELPKALASVFRCAPPWWTCWHPLIFCASPS